MNLLTRLNFYPLKDMFHLSNQSQMANFLSIHVELDLTTQYCCTRCREIVLLSEILTKSTAVLFGFSWGVSVEQAEQYKFQSLMISF